MKHTAWLEEQWQSLLTAQDQGEQNRSHSESGFARLAGLIQAKAYSQQKNILFPNQPHNP